MKQENKALHAEISALRQQLPTVGQALAESPAAFADSFIELRYDSPKRHRPNVGICTECGSMATRTDIHDSHSADVIAQLCDVCRDKRLDRLEAMYRGD